MWCSGELSYLYLSIYLSFLSGNIVNGTIYVTFHEESAAVYYSLQKSDLESEIKSVFVKYKR